MSDGPRPPADTPGSRLARSSKRTADVVVAVVLLVATLPLLVATAVAIYLTMGRPVLFRQLRPGYRGIPFTVMKFRTMRSAAYTGEDDAPRVTRLGGWLRRFSIDELPQLVNVLRGELSLVGPRPLLMEYLPLYSPEQARRHDVPPGITGWAQVHGRDAVSWEDRFEMDRWYVEHWSLGLDLSIVARTVLGVIGGDGIAPGGAPIADEWRGNDQRGPSGPARA